MSAPESDDPNPFAGMGPAKIEPNADQRAGAREIRALYNALVTDGQFTPYQALIILGTWMGTMSNGSVGESDG